jgi:hypothetical protein
MGGNKDPAKWVGASAGSLFMEKLGREPKYKERPKTLNPVGFLLLNPPRLKK